MNETAQSLIEYSRENGRVCPMPVLWVELWEGLPNLKRAGNSWEPSPPLILAAWHYASEDDKRNCLAGHIQWADKEGDLERVALFIRNLKKSEWVHSGEL